MSKPKFPKNPGINRPNPFEDETGENPFGDAAPPIEMERGSADANPYATAEEQLVQPYQPEGYETFLPHRGSLVYRLGAAACWVQALSILVAAVAAAIVGELYDGLIYGTPTQLFGLALSVPAWVLGHSDSAAIAAGAMDQDGQHETSRGLWLAIAATMVGCLQLGLLVGLSIYRALYI